MKALFRVSIRVVICAAIGWTAPLSAVRAEASCLVPDGGSGTAMLPLAGCAYLSRTNAREVVNGLSPGTTVVLSGMHPRLGCGSADTPPTGCSFAPSPTCRQPGGTMGGERGCGASTLSLSFQGAGTLAG